MRVKTPKQIRVKSPKMKVSKQQKKRNDLTFAFRNSSHSQVNKQPKTAIRL